MKKLLSLIFIFTAVGNISAGWWTDSEVTNGIIYRYDKLLGARWNWNEQDYEYQIVSDERLCYDVEDDQVCDSIPVCYVVGFEPGEDGKIVIPQFVILEVLARREGMGKFKHTKMSCKFRVVGLFEKRQPSGQEKVKELYANITSWERHNGTEILAKTDLDELTNLEVLSLHENFLDDDSKEHNGLTKIPMHLLKQNSLKKLFIAAPNFNIANNKDQVFSDFSHFEDISIRTSIQNDIPANMCIGMKNLNSFALRYDIEDAKSIRATIGKNAFAGCENLQSVVIDHVVEIGNLAFKGCKSLRSLSINPNANTTLERIGDYAFLDAAIPGRNLVFDGYNEPIDAKGWLHGVKELGVSAFENTNLESVSFIGYVPEKLHSDVFKNCKSLRQLAFDKVNLSVITEAVQDKDHPSIIDGCTAFNTLTIYNDDEELTRQTFKYDWPWTVLNNQITTINYKGSASNRVPKRFFRNTTALSKFTAEATDDAVICESAFENSAITSVPYSILTAGEHSFENSKLQSVKFAKGTALSSVVICRYAFQNTQLKSVVFNDGVYGFWEDAFAGSPITYADFSAIKQDWNGHEHARTITKDKETEASESTTIRNIIPAAMFDRCPIKHLNLSSKTQGIHHYAFRGNALSSIFIPDKVTEVGYGAFGFDSKISENGSIYIGPELVSIADNAFNTCNDDMTGFVKDNKITNITWLSSAYKGEPLKNIFPNATSVSFVYVDKYCESIPDNLCEKLKLTSVEFSSKTKRIGDKAFNSTNISSLTIPTACEYIGAFAFGSNLKLTDIKIPSDSKLKTISEGAFVLTAFKGTLELPETLEYIGRVALPTMMSGVNYNCKNLKTGNPFLGCVYLSTINVREGVETIPDSMFMGTMVTSITIPTTVKKLGRDLLKDAIQVGGTQMRINYNAKNATFTYNTEYTDETLLNTPEDVAKPWELNPWGVQELNQVVNKLDYYEQFSGYTDKMLQTKYDIVIGDGVETIPDFMFAGMKTHRETLRLPKTIKNIGKWAFYRSDIKTLRDSSSVFIANYAFVHADSLRNATFAATEDIGSYAFAGDSLLHSVSINKGLVTIGESAFEGCKSLIGLNMGDALQTIGAKAFKGCVSFGSITLGTAMTKVGDNAFDSINGGVLTIKAPVQFGSLAFKDAGISSMHLESLTEVPQIEENTFSGVPTDIMIWTNCTTMPLFKTDEQWKQFTNYSTRSPYSVTISPAVDWHEGDIIYTHPDCDNKTTLTAKPAEFFSFKQWSDGSTENPRTLTLTEDLQISATFEKTGGYTMKYFLFNFSTPEGATFSEDPSGWYPIEYEGAYLLPIYNIELTANEHFRFDFNQSPMPRDTKGNVIPQAPSWMCSSDEGPESCTKATMSFDYADNDGLKNALTDTIVITIPVVGEMVRLTDVLQVSDNNMGGLYYYYDKEDYKYQLYGIAEGDKAPYGDKITIYAHPITGHEFTGWDDGSTDEVRTITVGDKVYTANFEPKQYLVTFSVSEPEYAKLLAWGGEYKYFEQTYSYGEAVDLLPDEYIQVLEAAGSFDHWEVNGKVAEIELIEDDWFGPYPYLKDPITEDLNIVAVIRLNEIKATVASSANDKGSASVAEESPYLYGEQITITATPANENYRFSNWSDGLTENPRAVTLTQDTTIVANFAPDTYNVSVTIIPQGAAVAMGTGEYSYGDDYTISVIPNIGYELKEWRDGIVLEEKTNTLSGKVYGNVNIEVEFQLSSHKIQTEVNDAAAGVVQGSGTYKYGEQVKLTAQPFAHHLFTGWTDDISLPAERTITVTSDATYKALFDAEMVTVTISVSDELMGSAEANVENLTLPYGAEITLTAKPTKGYKFSHWSDGSADNPHIIIAGETTEITAVFEPEVYIVSIGEYDHTMGAVTIDSRSYKYLSYAHLIAKANEGYQFLGWDNGDTDEDIYVLVTGNLTITPRFAEQSAKTFTIKLLASPAEGGLLTGAGRYLAGTTAIIEALPDEGYEFIDWNDGNTDNPRSVVVNADATYTANFSPIESSIEDLDTRPSAPAPRKELRNGHVIIILPDGREFDATGVKLK